MPAGKESPNCGIYVLVFCIFKIIYIPYFIWLNLINIKLKLDGLDYKVSIPFVCLFYQTVIQHKHKRGS